MGNPVVSKSKSVGTHPAKPLKTLFGAILAVASGDIRNATGFLMGLFRLAAEKLLCRYEVVEEAIFPYG